MSQLIKPQIKWTPEKLQLLRDEYPLGDKNKLANDLGIKRSTLKDAARRFKIKSELDRRQYKAKNLLDESLESYYWHGFIMADGHIAYRNAIKVTLHPKDTQQLLNLKDFLQVDQQLKFNICSTSYSPSTSSITLAISDIDACEKFRNLYKVGNNKTINPPNLDHLLKNKNIFMAFFIGLFDGDGCFDLRKNNTPSCMKIECHGNWFSVLQTVSDNLKNMFDIDSTLKMTKRGYTCFRIYKYEFFKIMKNFIIENNIPAMQRKWEFVDVDRNNRFKL